MSAYNLDIGDDRRYVQLESQLAEARRAAHVNAQRVVELESELLQVRPAAAALHTYCAAIKSGSVDDVIDAADALKAVHEATTPSQTPPTHVIVAVDELDALRAIADAAAARRLAAECMPEYAGGADGALDDALDAYPGGAS